MHVILMEMHLLRVIVISALFRDNSAARSRDNSVRVWPGEFHLSDVSTFLVKSVVQCSARFLRNSVAMFLVKNVEVFPDNSVRVFQGNNAGDDQINIEKYD